jgi:hypothetical protein
METKLSDKAKKKVKEIYPNAKVSRDGAFFFVTNNDIDLGAGFTKEGAWCSAGYSIKNKKTEAENE